MAASFAGKARGARGARPERPSKLLGEKNMPGLCRACLESSVTEALGIALLLFDEGFQETLRSQVGIPNASKGSVFAL